MDKRLQRWLALALLPAFFAGTLVACQRAGEDRAGSSSGTSSSGTSQSGGGKSSDSRRIDESGKGSGKSTSSESQR